MNRTYEEWLKYYENATKEQVIEDMMLDIKELKQLKKQKDDVVVFAKKEKENYLTKACRIADTNNAGLITSAAIYTCDEILRMLGEIDEHR